MEIKPLGYLLLHLPLPTHHRDDRVAFVDTLNEYAARGWRIVCYLGDGDFVLEKTSWVSEAQSDGGTQ